MMIDNSKKNIRSKQLSNSFSTGGGGVYFEADVAASFALLMLTGGYAPCMPNFPISKIMLQAKYAGYETDDMVVFVEEPRSGSEHKLLVQIKHTINITEKDKVFGEVIMAAWKDFNNANLFSKGKDAIALITGPLNETDIRDVRAILDCARASVNVEEFLQKIELAIFSSKKKQKKLEAFKIKLKNANNGIPVSDNDLFLFLNKFFLLGYDLDIKYGVIISLLQSLISQYSKENTMFLWTYIVKEVQSANKNAETLTPERFPDKLRNAFIKQPLTSIPKELASSYVQKDKLDWNNFTSASDLVVANLLGSWNEKNDADRKVISQFAETNYVSWISKIREILQQSTSPIALKNGKWRVIERKDLWTSLSPRIFDGTLENFKQCVISVLSERDPQFDLPVDQRFGASLYGKVLQHSYELRYGLAESLAILGNYPEDSYNCSQNKPKSIVVLAIREILQGVDWRLWGSLDNVLPLLAEAAPQEFLNAVENSLQEPNCPFDNLFLQESGGVTGRNYMTGLIWALETLAWEEKYVIQACILLAELAKHDPGGQYTNRPANSLTTILLPWFPQTTAPFEKRKVLIRTLQNELPEITWKLLISLLPNQQTVSTGTHKPSWRMVIPEDDEKTIKRPEYLEQIIFYSDTAVSMALLEPEKLNELIDHLDVLPLPSIEIVLDFLSSRTNEDIFENYRLKFWTSLTKLTTKHKRNHGAEWVMSDEVISKIDNVASKIAPTNPLYLYRRLFGDIEYEFDGEDFNIEEQNEKQETSRRTALQEIIEFSGLSSLLQFIDFVKTPYLVGWSLGFLANAETDRFMLPQYLDFNNPKIENFVRGYVKSRFAKQGWKWCDELVKASWSVAQIGQFLCYLPFSEKTWKRVNTLLGLFENNYWLKVDVYPISDISKLEIAIDKLLEFGRPNAAIDCLYYQIHNQKLLDNPRCVKALLAVITSTEPKNDMDQYQIIEVIKKLQDDPATNPDDLFRIEWAYLPLLDLHGGASAKGLEKYLASDPTFFCQVIRLIYRSKKDGVSEKEPSVKDRSIAENSMILLREWRMPPGLQSDGFVSKEIFLGWLEKVITECSESGHLDVALIHIGQVLFYCPPDQSGFWIDKCVANALNRKDMEKMRNGFRMAVINSRGFQWIDPTGKPERDLAEQYRQKADVVENEGYIYFAVTLRELSEEFDREAERIIAEHEQDMDQDKK